MGLKARLRDVAAQALDRLGATRPARSARGQLTIVTFHRVLPENERRAYPFPGLAVTPDELRWHLRWLRGHFHCATLADAHGAVSAGEEGEHPWLAVTFDDGQLDNFVHAAPVLAEERVPASFFVPVAHLESGQPLWHDRVGFAVSAALGAPASSAELKAMLQDHGLAVGAPTPDSVTAGAKALAEAPRRVLVEELEAAFGPDRIPGWAGMMDWDQLGKLAAAGHEIGSHTMTHPILPSCDDERLARELADSRRRLEAQLAIEVESFCYPNGDADARVGDAVRSAGYRRAVTTRWGLNRRGQDPMALQRCDIRAEHSVDARGALSSARLAWRLSGLHPGPR